MLVLGRGWVDLCLGVVDMGDKSVIVVEHALGPYRVRKYNHKGDVVEEYWGRTKFVALEKANDINDKFWNIVQRDM